MVKNVRRHQVNDARKGGEAGAANDNRPGARPKRKERASEGARGQRDGNVLAAAHLFDAALDARVDAPNDRKLLPALEASHLAPETRGVR